MDKIKLFCEATPIIGGVEGIPVFSRNLIRHLAVHPDIELYSGMICSNMSTHHVYYSMLKTLSQGKIKYHKIFFPGRWGGKFPGVSISSKKYDLMHYSMHTVPTYCMSSDFSNTILTVHDMFLWHKEYQLDSPLIKTNLPVQAEKCRAIFTVSEFSKQEIHKYLGIPLEKIYAVPIAAQWSDIAFTPSNILQRTKLSKGSYFLSVSSLLPHKNHLALLAAFDKYRSCSDYGGEKLVFVGRRTEYFSKICRAIDSCSWCIHLEKLPENDLRTLYENCRGFFLVSKLEGFGIPLLEAMGSRVPSCYGQGSSMDEIGRKAAWGVDPYNIDQIAEMFARFSAGGKDIETRVEQAYNISCEYSYKKTIDSYVKIYKKLLTE